MNFFDYVKLITMGWDPLPPEGEWPTLRKALLEMSAVHKAAMQEEPATHIDIYIRRMDKELNYVGPVE